jgi:hypothetical protein
VGLIVYVFEKLFVLLKEYKQHKMLIPLSIPLIELQYLGCLSYSVVTAPAHEVIFIDHDTFFCCSRLQSAQLVLWYRGIVAALVSPWMASQVIGEDSFLVA